MGLRERHAAHTREAITQAALSLFGRQGYDRTTMEEIAEAADVGTSTLYRYFPSKDLLVVEPFALHGQMAAELRDRPRTEPLDLALGHALRALLSTPRPEPERLRVLARLIDATPTLRARLWEEFERERVLLEEAIVERTGRPSSDPFCALTARLATTLLELVGARGIETAQDGDSAADQSLACLREVLALLHGEPPVLPRFAPA
jgi:AcrR family transcriptional regulator